MSKIKQLFRHLLPVLALPLIADLLTPLFIQILSRYGIVDLTAFNAFNSLSGILSSALYHVALISLVVTAILAESGKAKAARILHLISLGVYCLILLGYLLACFIAPRNMALILVSAPEAIATASSMLRLFALTVVLVVLLGAPVGQIVRRYSMIFTLCLCGSILLATLLLLLVLTIMTTGSVCYAAARALIFCAGWLLPFLLVPAASYHRAFLPPSRE